MNKLLPFSLVLFLAVGNVATPSIAAPATSNCNSILKSVKNALSGVVIFKQRNTGNMGQPRGRTQTLDITVKGDEDFPSQSMQKSIATRVIKSCTKMASVTFGIDQTDAGTVYGLKNGQIIKFACVEAGGDIKPKWGETYCP